MSYLYKNTESSHVIKRLSLYLLYHSIENEM